MTSNIVGYTMIIAITTIISIGLYLTTNTYLNTIIDTIQNKNLEEIAFKIYFYLNQIKYMENNSTISYSFHSPYIFITPLKNGIKIEKQNKIGNFIYYENVSNFDCRSDVVYLSGNVLHKISDGIYEGTGINEIFVICDPNINITTHSSTKSGNYFHIYLKKINNSEVEVEI